MKLPEFLRRQKYDRLPTLSEREVDFDCTSDHEPRAIRKDRKIRPLSEGRVDFIMRSAEASMAISHPKEVSPAELVIESLNHLREAENQSEGSTHES